MVLRASRRFLLVFEMVLVFDHVGFGFSDAVAGFMVMQF